MLRCTCNVPILPTRYIITTVIPSSDIATIADKLGQSLRYNSGTREFIPFGKVDSTVITTYIGSEFDKSSVADLIQRLE